MPSTFGMSQLEQLPEHILREIVRHCLLSRRVKQSPNDLMIEHYAFTVNLLRVSRTIKASAEAILYGENRFVKIFSNFKDAGKSMLNHEVPFFKPKSAAKFTHHVAEVRALISSFNSRFSHHRLAKTVPFLLLMDDMPKYTRLFRLLDTRNFMDCEFNLTLLQPTYNPASLSINEQADFLKHFEQLCGMAMIQTANFAGPFDGTATTSLQQLMTRKVAWARAGLWEVYNMAASIERVGDCANKLRNEIATHKYMDVKDFT